MRVPRWLHSQNKFIPRLLRPVDDACRTELVLPFSDGRSNSNGYGAVTLTDFRHWYGATPELRQPDRLKLPIVQSPGNRKRHFHFDCPTWPYAQSRLARFDS